MPAGRPTIPVLVHTSQSTTILTNESLSWCPILKLCEQHGLLSRSRVLNISSSKSTADWRTFHIYLPLICQYLKIFSLTSSAPHHCSSEKSLLKNAFKNEYVRPFFQPQDPPSSIRNRRTLRYQFCTTPTQFVRPLHKLNQKNHQQVSGY